MSYISTERAMKLTVYVSLVLFVSSECSIYVKPKIETVKLKDGVEFNDISRGHLLRILSALEEQINVAVPWEKIKPTFTAQFSNNKYTKPFIYPEMFATKVKYANQVMESQKAAEPGFLTKTSLIQLGYGIWLNLTLVGIGMAFGWPAVAVPQLIEPNSSIHLTPLQQSWIASILTVASPFGCVLSGYIMDRFGRRRMLCIAEIPMAIGWLVTAFAKSASGIIIGRIITGIGTGMGFGGPLVYLAEITRPNMRGALGAFPNLALSIGVTVQATLGSYLKWRVLCYSCAVYSLVILISNLFLPETPYYMLTKSSEEKAKKSLMRFRSKDHDVDAEMADMIEFKRDNGIRSLPLKEQIKTLFKKSTCKPFATIAIYILFMQLAGAAIMIMWTVEILKHSKSSVDPHLGNVLLSITRGLIGVVTFILLFRVGRRPMALTSAFGLGVTCISLGFFIRYTTKITVLPQIGYMSYMTFASLGYYTLPFLLMCEVYPLQVRGLLSGITVSLHNFMMFATNFDFPYVRDAIGFENTIISFGIVSLIGFIFLYFALPETKGLTLQEIEEYFNKRRPSLVSERELKTLQLKEANKHKSGSKKFNLNIKSEKKADKKVIDDNTNKTDEGKSKSDEGTSRMKDGN